MKPKMKIVKIDDKTWIEVPENVPDEIARQRFINRLGRNKSFQMQKEEKEKTEAAREISIGTIEDMEEIVEKEE